MQVKYFIPRLMGYFLALLICCAGSLAGADTVAEKLRVRKQFEPIFNLISAQLSAHQSRYKKDPAAYRDFVDQYIREHWDANSTASALIGRVNFKALVPEYRQKLVEAVDTTLVRYAFEGFEYYDGQQFTLVDVAISNSGRMGWVQVVMESQIMPDLNLDILIKRTEEGIWKAVDIRFKGITYVAVKKHQFRKILQKQGAKALISSLAVKNHDFFDNLCVASDKAGSQSC